jgi:hypothetical protein
MAETQREADLINKERRERAAMTREQLERLGVICSVATYTGDSSYPTEYTLTYQDVRGVGPTMDMAVADFIESLLIALKKARRFETRR